jgi:hypothetical protein
MIMVNEITNDRCKCHYDISTKKNHLFIKLPEEGIAYKDLVEKVNVFALITGVPADTIQISYLGYGFTCKCCVRLFSIVENQAPAEGFEEGIQELIQWLNN